MAKQTLGSPAKKNDINLDGFQANAPLNTSSKPYAFYTVDECGVKRPQDLTLFDFEFKVLFNDCIQFDTNTILGGLVKGTGDDNNKLWFQIELLAVPKGVYQYTITEQTEKLHVIRGNITLI